ncbi:hypothetical protein FBU59_003632 [Linderina macrospora]|uniref:Uncharacterized protein n=1 Tax=Linderina macrospora TaxID=4868 RepID=A0ACC1J844_9FUNG|nr:hypothetical protein FBU59_003632 [Linderina macrospora]
MGLAEPKSRTLYSADPRNLHWSEDKSRFGFKMLEKMGWSEGKGLGANEDGRKEHVKIKLKSNNHGIGADKKTIRNWLENTDGFSELLSRLNSDSATPSDAPKPEETKPETKKVLTAASARLNRLSHRTKFRNMKRMAMQDDKGLQEILGVSSKTSTAKDTPASTVPDSERQSGESTPLMQTETVESGVSVSDYFEQKMKNNPALAAIYGFMPKEEKSTDSDDGEVDSKKRKASSDDDDSDDSHSAEKKRKSKKEKKEKKDKKSKKD